MKTISLISPAKLNLFLKVVNKRPDQYHNLQTLFERIDLCDRIRLRLNSTGAIRIFSRYTDIPKGRGNLVYKVAEMLRMELGVKAGVDIFINKKIPVAAGLGGGSSNAATVLKGLNRLWGLGLSVKELVEFAKRIGSDVPFFLYDCSWALGTDRGDEIRPLCLGKKLWHILVVPRVKVYSRKVFSSLKLQLTKKKRDVNMLPRTLRENNLAKAGQLLFNDLEPAVTKLHPNILKLKNTIKSLGVLGVCLSGSGPSVFGLTDSQKQAERIQSQLAKRYKQVFVVRTF